jgi:hypothetical protein
MAENGLTLLQDLVGLAQFTDLTLKFLDPIFLGTCQPGPLPGIAFGLLTPDAQAVRKGGTTSDVTDQMDLCRVLCVAPPWKRDTRSNSSEWVVCCLVS